MYISTKQRRRSAMIDGARQISEKTVRILSRRPIGVVLPDNLPLALEQFPAWTDGQTIYLNRQKLDDILADLMQRSADLSRWVVTFKGAVYHEMSHTLYTPRSDDDIQVWAREQDRLAMGSSEHRMAFNMLEDQRIEMMFSTIYRPAARYFEAAVLTWVMSNPAALSSAHLLTYGRKFLNLKVRKAARDAFLKAYGQTLLDELEDIIDSYLQVVYPTDSLKARSLITRFVALLKAVQPPQSVLEICADNSPHQHAGNGSPQMTEGRSPRKDDQKSARERVKDQIADDPIEEDLDPDDDMDDTDASGAGDADGDDGEDADDDGDAQSGNGGDADGDDESPSKGKGKAEGTAQSSTPGDGTGSASQEVSKGTPSQQALEEALDGAVRDAITNVYDDAQVQQDVSTTLDTIKSLIDGEHDATGNLASSSPEALPAEAAAVKNAVRNSFRRIQYDLEPFWQKKSFSGKVDLARIATRKPTEFNVFRRWHPGMEEEVGCEIVLCVDLSGSMHSKLKQLSMALWALKRAFDDLDFRTTVIGFSTKHYVIYKASDRVPYDVLPVFHAHDNTDPSSALAEAYEVLSHSTKPNKVLITLTDGEWGEHANSEAVIRTMNANGYVTMLLGLDHAVEYYGNHEHSIAADMEHVNDLPKIVRDLVERIIATATFAPT